jgi:hypothetical protein
MSFVPLALLAFVIASTSAVAASDQVRAMRRGQEVTLSNPARVADKLAADLESCSVSLARWGRAIDMWDHSLASDAYLHATYSPPRKLTLYTQGNQRRAVYAVEEILLPLPENKWPPYDLARIGGEVYAYAKCDPRRLVEIIREPELELRERQPYKSLMDALEAEKRSRR